MTEPTSVSKNLYLKDKYITSGKTFLYLIQYISSLHLRDKGKETSLKPSVCWGLNKVSDQSDLSPEFYLEKNSCTLQCLFRAPSQFMLIINQNIEQYYNPEFTKEKAESQDSRRSRRKIKLSEDCLQLQTQTKVGLTDQFPINDSWHKQVSRTTALGDCFFSQCLCFGAGDNKVTKLFEDKFRI